MNIVRNILTVEEMKKSEDYTIRCKNISSLKLMELAGIAVFNHITEELNKDDAKICIVCGIGNNGGDTLVVARHLFRAGYQINITMVGDPAKMTPWTMTNLDYLIELEAPVKWLNDNITFTQFVHLFSKSNVIIEGLFGIGLNRDITGDYREMITLINAFAIYTISIDIPSGIMGNGMVAGTCIKADVTYIIEPYKTGNLLNDALDYSGKMVPVDIGLITESDNGFYHLDEEAVLLPRERKRNSHKYHYGNILIIGGCTGMTGAPQMSAIAALRTGSGLCTIGINEKYYDNLNQLYPEIMVLPFGDMEQVESMVKKKDVIVFGPGLGRDEDNIKVLKYLISLEIPLIIDADGIYYLKYLLDEIKTPNRIIVTPHYGELGALLDTTSQAVSEDPLGYINVLTEKYGLTVVLKGCCTIIGCVDIRYFSILGNPGMATAGSGDVLTGIIASLAGQGMNKLEACKSGVYLHSRGGERASKKLGEASMIATDIINELPWLIKSHPKD